MEPQLHPFHDFPPQNAKIQQSKTLNFEKQRHKRVMGKLKNSIFSTLKASDPTRPISRALKSHIAKQMREFFPSFSTPTHPPYALMIETAIMELNEEGGSNEVSISGFIEKNYEGLPWGHTTFLSHHLRKLCGMGEIVRKKDGRYIIYVDQSGVEEECLVKGQENETNNEWNTVKEKQVVVFEMWRQVEKKAVEASEQEVERPSVSYDAWQRNPRYQHIKVKECPNNLQELQFEAIDKHALACPQRNQIVVFEQNIPAERQMRNIWEERKFVISCGLQVHQRQEPKICGQQKEPNSDNQKQQLSQDTTMGVLLSSDHQQDIEQRHRLQLEGQGRGKPCEIEGFGNHHGGQRIYVRRRRRA